MRKPSVHGGKWKSNEGIDNIANGPVNNMSFFMLWSDRWFVFKHCGRPNHLSKCAWNLNCHCGRKACSSTSPHYGNCHYGTSHGGIICLCNSVTFSDTRTYVHLDSSYHICTYNSVKCACSGPQVLYAFHEWLSSGKIYIMMMVIAWFFKKNLLWDVFECLLVNINMSSIMFTKSSSLRDGMCTIGCYIDFSWQLFIKNAWIKRVK